MAKDNNSFVQITVWNYFINKGFTENQVAGIMGNAMQESGWNPLRRGSGEFWGLFQLNRTSSIELERLYRAAGLDMNAYGYSVSRYQGSDAQKNISIADLERILSIQLGFVYDSRPAGMDWITPLSNAKTYYEAAEIFLVRFECARASAQNENNRISYYRPYVGYYFQEAAQRRGYAKTYYELFAK